MGFPSRDHQAAEWRIAYRWRKGTPRPTGTVAVTRMFCIGWPTGGFKGQVFIIMGEPTADNLVYLCFDHHDEYESTARQATGLTEREVRTWRDRLVAELAKEVPGSGPPYAENSVVLTSISTRHSWRHVWAFPMWLTPQRPPSYPA